jgi:hypothetical protein
MKKLLTSLALCAAGAAQAAPVVIDFEGLPLGTNPNPMVVSGASFTTVAGFTRIGDVGSNFLCTSVSSLTNADCSAALDLSFGGAASNISFEFFLNNISTVGADIGDIAIYAGAVLLGTEDLLVVDNDTFTLDQVSLTGYSNITRIVVTSTDFGGVGYDNFRFDRADTSTVPEPAGLALVLTAAGLAGAAARRRRPLTRG